MEEFLQRSEDALQLMCREGVKAAQNKFNVRKASPVEPG
jgi:hypothetical protein